MPSFFAEKFSALAGRVKWLTKEGVSRPRLIGLLLALITLLVYLPVYRCSFLVYDDDDYVTQNPVVQNGLTWAGVQWAFTTEHASNWHPLTWLSHMLDCELFGLNPGAQHLVNVLFHAANAVLLFGLLMRLMGLRSDTATGASSPQASGLWPGAFAAALFAWHPLHVESVAWISERKDVLSMFFGLLALLAYARYAEEFKVQGSRFKVFYGLALVFFAPGLMSKPMLVTLPFIMLLLDYWPFNRVRNAECGMRSFIKLLLEKIPFFLLTAVSCVVTFLAQRHGEAIVPLARVDLGYRLENAPVAVVRYLLKIVWPANLAVIYPMPSRISGFAVVVAVAVLIFLSVAVWRTRRRNPYWLVGWLWFLGTLVPVLGFVQVGGAALADRYTYLPAIGLFLAVACGFRDWADRLQIPRAALTAGAVLILGGCIAVTEHQLRFWRDSEALFRHALTVTENNEIAHINLGVALDQEGRETEALAEYRLAAKLAPGRYQVHNDLGNLLDKMNQPESALAEYREAVRLEPKLPVLRDGLGSVLAELGRFDGAMMEFTNAAQLDPAYPWPHFELAKALLAQGRDAEALGQFREALRIDPDNFQILAYTARVLAAEENPAVRDGKAALALATRANALTDGTQPLVLDALGMAYAATGDFTNAQTCAQNALALADAVGMKERGGIEKRQELYKSRQPWRESFQFTNAPAKNDE